MQSTSCPFNSTDAFATTLIYNTCYDHIMKEILTHDNLTLLINRNVNKLNSVSIESFTDLKDNNLINLNILLKAILFACVFYLLRHNETQKYLYNLLKKTLNLKKNYLLVLLMSLFIVCHYVLNLFI